MRLESTVAELECVWSCHFEPQPIHGTVLFNLFPAQAPADMGQLNRQSATFLKRVYNEEVADTLVLSLLYSTLINPPLLLLLLSKMLLSKVCGPFSLAFSVNLRITKPPSPIGLKLLSIVDELQKAAQAAKNKHQKGTRLLSRLRPKKKENIDSVSTDVLATKDIDAAPLRRMVARHPLTIDHTIERTPFAPRKLSALFPQVLLRSRTVNLRRALGNTTAYRSPSPPEIRPLRLFIVLPPRSQIAASAPLICYPVKDAKALSDTSLRSRTRNRIQAFNVSLRILRRARSPNSPAGRLRNRNSSRPLDPEISSTFVWMGHAPEWALLDALLLSFSGFRRR
jgi:hypothetical protein